MDDTGFLKPRKLLILLETDHNGSKEIAEKEDYLQCIHALHPAGAMRIKSLDLQDVGNAGFAGAKTCQAFLSNRGFC